MARREIAVVALVAGLLAGGIGAGSAQQATPGAALFPLTPEPARCRVAPRPLQTLEPLLGEAPTPAPPSTAAPGASPVPGVPADAAVVDAVRATAIELYACFNAGDFLRAYALFTDDYLRRLDAVVPLTREMIDFFGRTPVPVPAARRIVLLDVRDVVGLPDGRVGAVLQIDNPGIRREAQRVVLVRVGDRYLIDEIAEATVLGTPAP